MAYPDLDPGKFGPGMPLDVSNMEALYKGLNKTNGFLMRNVDGRVPALQQPLGRLSISVENALSDDGIVPWGNGLWRNLAALDTQPGIAQAQKPAKSFFCGVLKFNQGWQAGNPVAPHGLADYSKGVIVSKGLVGYKTAMTEVGQEENYLDYLKGKTSQDIPDVRTTYKDWIELYKAANDGDKLGLFFGNDSGFPIVAVVAAEDIAAPALDDATFAGFAEVFEPENEAVFFDIRL